MRAFRFIVLLLSAGLLADCATKPAEQSSEAAASVEAPAPRYAYGIALDDYRIDTCRVLAGETLSGILNRHGLSSRQWRDMQPFLKQHPELASIREGGRYYAFRNDTALCYYAYCINRRETMIASLLDSFYIWRSSRALCRCGKRSSVRPRG